MPVTQYRVFTEIVDSGSLAAAARKLHLSPSAISKQLQQLETRLGAKLIQRSTRSMQVTEPGEVFYHRCLAILQAAEFAEAEVSEASGELSGTLKLTLPEVMATAEMSQLLRQFSAEHRAISFDIDVNDNPQNLIEKNLDVGFRAGPLRDSRLIAAELFQAEIVMVAAPAYIKQYGAPENIKALQAHTLLVADPVYLTPSGGHEDYNTDIAKPGQSIQCGNVSLLVELAMAGTGIALLWRNSAQPKIESGELLELSSPIAHQRRAVSIVYISRDYLPARTRLFIDHVKNYYRA